MSEEEEPFNDFKTESDNDDTNEEEEDYCCQENPCPGGHLQTARRKHAITRGYLYKI